MLLFTTSEEAAFRAAVTTRSIAIVGSIIRRTPCILGRAWQDYSDSLQDLRTRRYNHLANRPREAQAWPGSRALLFRTCPTMSPSAVIGASPCFSRPTTI